VQKVVTNAITDQWSQLA